MNTTTRSVLLTVTAWVLAAIAEAQGVIPAPIPIESFERLNYSGGSIDAEISYDGQVVFVTQLQSFAPGLTLRWPYGGTPVAIAPGNSFDRTFTDATGSLAVGVNAAFQGATSFLWTAGTGLIDITALFHGLPGTLGWVEGISAFNMFTIGSTPNLGRDRLYHLLTGASIVLPEPAPLVQVKAYGISATGRFVVGVINPYTAGERAYIYDITTGLLTPLGALAFPTPNPISKAVDVSAQGVVVGYSSSNTNATALVEAFVRDMSTNPPGPMIGLGVLSQMRDSFATAISADGRYVVGYCSGPGERAFVYDRLNPGMQELETYLKGSVTLPANFELIRATDINASGNAITGYGKFPGGITQAFRTL